MKKSVKKTSKKVSSILCSTTTRRADKEEIDGPDDSAPGGSGTEYPYTKLTNQLTPNTEVLHEWMHANQLPPTNMSIFQEQYAILQFTHGVVPLELKKALNPHPFQRKTLTLTKK